MSVLKRLNSVQIWLCCWFASASSLMVGVGGATRLTHSGLSMVDWKPITGILPPLNEAGLGGGVRAI